MLNLPDIQAGDDLRLKGGWFNAIKREVQRLGKITGDGSIIVSNDGGGVSIRLNGKTSSSPASATSASYAGPFAVVKKDDTTVTILGYHADEDRNWKNYVYAGLTATEVAEQDKASITTSGYLYLDVTYSGGYSVAVGFATSVPAQSATHYYHPLAWVSVFESKVSSILQMQYGQIFIAGRVV